METSFKDQGEQHCFYNIIFMMRICHFIASHLLYSLIECAFSHFGAEGTGVGFLSGLKENGADLRGDDCVGDGQLSAQLLDGGQVEIPQAEVNGDGGQLKWVRIKPFQAVQGIEESKAVFSA